MKEMTSRVAISRVSAAGATVDDDEVAIEEPLEIRVNERPLSVTMRTPGDDFALAAGFLRTEGVIARGADIESIRHWGSPNVVRVALRVPVDWQRLQRHFYATSSCGVCGKTSIDAVRIASAVVSSTMRVSSTVIHALPDALRAKQEAFASTGAIHAAGIFTADGELLRVAEDVGRHNAVDKAIGAFVVDDRPLGDVVLVISGRGGFEIVQKAAVAGIAMIVAVGAPSSLAVELAREMGVTLIGFARDARFNVYANEERVCVSASSEARSRTLPATR
jgi:FdhD protein